MLYWIVCEASMDSNTCIVVDASMTMTVTSRNEEDMTTKALMAIRHAMEMDILVSQTPGEIVKLTYLGSSSPNPTTISQDMEEFSETETPPHSIDLISEEDKDTSHPSLMYAFFGLIPLVVGLTAVLSLRPTKQRIRTVPQEKKGYHFHNEEEHFREMETPSHSESSTNSNV